MKKDKNVLYFNQHGVIKLMFMELLEILNQHYTQQFYTNEINTGAFGLIEDVDGSWKLTGILAFQKKLMQSASYQNWLQQQMQQQQTQKKSQTKSRSFSFKMNKNKKINKKTKSPNTIALMRMLSKFPQGKKMMLQFGAINRYSLDNLELGQYRQDKSLTNLSTNLNNIISSNFLLLDKFKSYQFIEKEQEKSVIPEQKTESRHSYRNDDQALLQQAQSLYSSAAVTPKTNFQQSSNSYSYGNSGKDENQFGLLKRFEKDYSYTQKSEPLTNYNSFSQSRQNSLSSSNSYQKQEQFYTKVQKPTEFFQEYIPKESTRMQINKEITELREQLFNKKNEQPSLIEKQSNNNYKKDSEISLLDTKEFKDKNHNTFSYTAEPEKAQKLREMERKHSNLLLEIDNYKESDEEKQKSQQQQQQQQQPKTLSQQIEQLEQQTNELQSTVAELQHKVYIKPQPEPTNFLKQMLRQKEIIPEEKKPSNYSEVLKQALQQEKISQEEQEKKLTELQEKVAQLQKQKEELSQQQEENNNTELISIEKELELTQQNLEKNEEEHKETKEKVQEIERIWEYTHPEGKKQYEMELKAQKEISLIEEKSQENFFSKLKNSIGSLFSLGEKENNKETQSQENQENQQENIIIQDEMENQLINKFVDKNIEEENNQNQENNQETNNQEQNQQAIDSNNEEQNYSNDEIQTEPTEQSNKSNTSEPENNEETQNNDSEQSLLELSNGEFNELDFLNEFEEDELDLPKNDDSFIALNQNLATIINFNTQQISDVQLNKKLMNSKKLNKIKQNQKKPALQLFQNDDDFFDPTTPLKFQTSFIQKITMDEQQKITLQFITSQQCHRSTLFKRKLQIDFTEYLITRANLQKNVYFVRSLENNQVLSSENLSFTTKPDFKDGFVFSQANFNNKDETYHSIIMSSPKTKENIILENSQQQPSNYELIYTKESQSLLSIIPLSDTKKVQKQQQNDEIITEEEIMIINNKTNSFLVNDNKNENPIFTQYKQNFDIEHATWMLHTLESVFCQNIFSTVMVKPKFQQKFWNQQEFYLYNPTFNVYLTADLVLSDEVTLSDDIFEIQFDSTQTSFSLISKKYKLPVSLNQKTNEIIVNPLSYSKQASITQQEFILLSLETLSTDFYMIVNSESQKILSVEQMENFASLTKEDSPVVFQLWELIPANELEE